MAKDELIISVIVPTCNRNDFLRKCLDELHPALQQRGVKYEVIVSDDSKEQLAKSLVELDYPWVQYKQSLRKGPSANRNNGAKEAKGDWLIFLDDDVIPDRNLIYNYHFAIERWPDIFAFEGSIYPDDEKLLKRDLSECPINIQGNLFWSANICINRTFFESFGGFNERFSVPAHEDQQIKIDIEKRGKILFLPECKVIHPVRFSTLRKQIQKIPKLSAYYAVFLTSNEKVSTFPFYIKQMIFHFKVFLSHVKHSKIKNATVEAAWLIYGIPLIIIHLLKIKKVH